MPNNRLSQLLLLCLLPLAARAAEPSDIELHKAVLKNDAELVKTLIGQGVSVEQRDGDRMTPIFRAAYKGYDEITGLLIAAGAEVNATDKWGNTPIFLAASGGRVATVELLINNGAKIDVINSHSKNPLFAAVRNDQALAAKLLLKRGADPNVWSEGVSSTPLHYAVIREDVELVGELLESGALVNAKGENNATPLHMASAHGRMRAVELLIAAGADVNALADETGTPLHHALRFGWTNVAEIVSELLKHGADPDVTDARGRTALEMAEKEKSDSSVMFALAGQVSAGPTNSLPPTENLSPPPAATSNTPLQGGDRDQVAPSVELSNAEEPARNTDDVQDTGNAYRIPFIVVILVVLVVAVLLLRGCSKSRNCPR